MMWHFQFRVAEYLEKGFAVHYSFPSIGGGVYHLMNSVELQLVTCYVTCYVGTVYKVYVHNIIMIINHVMIMAT